MAKLRLSMRKIKEALRLIYICRLSYRNIGLSCGVSISTIAEYYRRAQAAQLTRWEGVAPLSEGELESRLFPAEHPLSSQAHSQPDFVTIQKELKAHKNVNLTLDQLWQEYKEQNPTGYQYSQFCDLYRKWRKKQTVWMRQTHKGGEKVFVDYCDGLFLLDPRSGKKTSTQLFVGVWGASNFTFAEFTFSQDLPSWVGSHNRMLTYFNCAPAILVPDNLKSGVTKPCRYEPEINATYQDFAEHYGIAIVPARSKKARDKAKVEAGCLIAQRWILAVLRHQTFTSLADLNATLKKLLEKMNHRPMRKIKKSRWEVFEIDDKPNAKPLPAKPYEYADWLKARVNIDYHIAVEDHYYSVPFRYAQEPVDVRLTATMVEVIRKGQRIAAHPRSFVKHKHTTLTDHMPLAHQKYVEWNPARIKSWAEKTGPLTLKFVEALMKSKAHPEQAYRACLGVFRLAKSYPKERIEAAAARALRYNMCSYKSLDLILRRGMDQQPEPDSSNEPTTLPNHGNIRGQEYYQ